MSQRRIRAILFIQGSNMNDNYYARCIICGNKYRSKMLLDLEKTCRCGYAGQVLYPKYDIIIRANYTDMLMTLSQAQDQAFVMANKTPEFALAPKIAYSIRKRIVDQRRERKQSGFMINWHELKIIGYWATDSLETKKNLMEPSKFQGIEARVFNFLLQLEMTHFEWEALSPASKIARDKMAAWWHKYGDKMDYGPMDSNEEKRELTEEAIETCPDMTDGETKDNILNKVKRIKNASGSTEEKTILGADGQSISKVNAIKEPVIREYVQSDITQ